MIIFFINCFCMKRVFRNGCILFINVYGVDDILDLFFFNFFYLIIDVLELYYKR